MEPPEGDSGQRKGVKSEWRPIMGRTALQDLGHSERKQTYTMVSMRKRGTNLMNKGEVYTWRKHSLHQDCELGWDRKEH
jgi:hypothetical protein